jgi:hypothetical protein
MIAARSFGDVARFRRSRVSSCSLNVLATSAERLFGRLDAARSASQPYDAILLDIDNGPSAMVQSSNAKVYDLRGIARIGQALKPGGRVAIWSSGADKAFESRLSHSGFDVKPTPVKKHATAKSTTYMIYVADKKVLPAKPEVETAAAAAS